MALAGTDIAGTSSIPNQNQKLSDSGARQSVDCNTIDMATATKDLVSCAGVRIDGHGVTIGVNSPSELQQTANSAATVIVSGNEGFLLMNELVLFSSCFGMSII